VIFIIDICILVDNKYQNFEPSCEGSLL